MHDHTLKHFKEEIWEHKLLDHKNWDGWVKGGKKGLDEEIKERAKWILENHRPKGVEGRVRERLKEIIKKREKELKSSS